jgi:hypothetical protein
VTRSRAHIVGVPEAIRSREDLAGAYRAITYELAVGDAQSMSTEQWARATWEGAPTIVRWFLMLDWRFVLGLRLAPKRSSTNVLGWRIIDDRPDTITLQARSVLITGRNIVIAQESTLLLRQGTRPNRRRHPWRIMRACRFAPARLANIV